MAEQKFENMLNISIGATRKEREKSFDLDTGVDDADDLWEVIIKYAGSIKFLEELYDGVKLTELLNGYAVGVVPKRFLDTIVRYPQIEYIEKPKKFFLEDFTGNQASCINQVIRPPYNLSGEGTIVAVIDSGVNILLPEFQDENGNTRIIYMWDQTDVSDSEEYYGIGREYNSEEINRNIAENNIIAQDNTGHGTPVASIACGNTGIAAKSDIIIVKLALSDTRGFPRTTQVMLGIDYVIRKAQQLGRPAAVNLSFGNNYGSHTGNSLFERYIDDVSRYWQTVICVGSGNEAASATHTSVIVDDTQDTVVEFGVSTYQTGINLQIWKNYADEYTVSIVSPDGRIMGPLTRYNTIQRYEFAQMTVLGYLGQPSPYTVNQEIFFDLIPKEDYLISGIWKIVITPERIVDGRTDMWLPSDAALNAGTGFLYPQADNTLTIPSTAQGVITVGAYNARTGAYAPFSGRGNDITFYSKPDIAAPGVGVRAVSSNGIVREYTGTSFATPFVTGSAALLMEWGIVRGNDAFLYGEKVKAYFINGAGRMEGYSAYPNPQTGWGRLCVADSIPV